MNIAIYQPRVSYYVGGGEILPLEHGVFLRKRGHKITIVTTRAPFIKESDHFKNYKKANKDIQIDYIDLSVSQRWLYKIPPGEDWGRWNLESVFVGQIAMEYFLRRRFDIVTVYNVLDMCAVPHGQKSALHLLGYPQQVNLLYKNCLGFADTILAVSEYVKERWLKMVRLKNIYVAKNGIRSDYFKPLKNLKKYDVLFLGRLIKVKGVDYLIRAVSLLKKEDIILRVAIAGDGMEKGRLESLSRRLGLTKSVQFLGHVKSDKLVGLYNSAKMTALPSYDREGILITMLESSACGIPVVTTTACSMKEFIKTGENGLLVKPKSADGLAKAIKLIYGDNNLRERLSRNVRAEIVKNWDWKIKIKKVEEIYEKILSNR